MAGRFSQVRGFPCEKLDVILGTDYIVSDKLMLSVSKLLIELF